MFPLALLRFPLLLLTFPLAPSPPTSTSRFPNILLPAIGDGPKKPGTKK